MRRSLRVGSMLEGDARDVASYEGAVAADVGDVDAGQPRTWTFLDFEADDGARVRSFVTARRAAGWG